MTEPVVQSERLRARGTNMADQSFHTFLAQLEAKGELVRFKKAVHPTQNMSAVEWKTYAEPGEASEIAATMPPWGNKFRSAAIFHPNPGHKLQTRRSGKRMWLRQGR
jgi:hypothetical protein